MDGWRPCSLGEVIDQHELVRQRQPMAENSLPLVSSEDASSAMHPATLRQSETRQQEESKISSNDSCRDEGAVGVTSRGVSRAIEQMRLAPSAGQRDVSSLGVGRGSFN